MPIPNLPDFLEDIIGRGADVLPIPARDYPDPAQNGALNYATAWPAVTGIPLEAGGKAPRREYFNALARLISSHIFFLQSGGVYVWQASLDYLAGAHILDDGVEYVAQTASGPDVPDVGAKKPSSDDGTYWKPTRAGGGGGFLAGSVIMFSGTFGGTGSRFPIPLGENEPDLNWVLCDGTETNGLPVPDLRDRMIIGAGNAYATGAKGGSSTHDHSLSGTVGATTLDGNTLANHSHVVTAGNFKDGGDVTFRAPNRTGANFGTNAAGGSQPHTHSLSAATGAANNMPPYYALAFIMRL